MLSIFGYNLYNNETIDNDKMRLIRLNNAWGSYEYRQ
jgi:hypothetical protein